MFSKPQIEKLVPLIVKENLLSSGMWSYYREWSNEEIKSPLFPKLFVLLQKSEELSKVVKRSVEAQGLRLSGSGCNADGAFHYSRGHYYSNRVVNYGGVDCTIWVGQHEEANDDWVTYGDTEPELDEDGEPDEDTIDTKIMWRNHYSSNLPLPPETGWKLADKLAYGTPEIEYTYKENESDE